MKHLWIINHYAQRPDEAGGVRHYSLAKYLHRHGWRTSIIASSVELNTCRQRLRPDENHRLEDLDEVQFLWLKTPAYRGNGPGRIRNMLAFTRAALRLPQTSLLPPPDVVLGSTVHPFAAWAGLRLARHYAVPFVFEVRDLWPETLVQFGRLSPHSPLTLALRWLEKHLAREAEHIISVLPRAAAYFSRYQIPPSRLSWLPNGADADLGALPEAHTGASFTLTYLGAHGHANSLHTLLDALAHIRQSGRGQGIRCRLIGDGPLKPQLQAQAAALGLDTVAFLAPLPRAALAEALKTTDAFILCARDCPALYQYGVSMNKVFDYMALGRPIIAALDAAADPLTESGCALIVPPEDPPRLADAITRMSALSKDERLEMAKRGRRAVQEKYNYRLLAGELAATLDRLHGG